VSNDPAVLVRFNTISMVLVAVIVLSPPLQSQSQPDFSGTWTLDSRPAADTPVRITVKQVLVRTNVRGEPIAPLFRQIVITRAGRTESYDIGAIGGSMSGIVGGPVSPLRTHQRLAWEEQVLVIESGSYTGGARETGDWTERREAWSIDSDGRLRVRISTRGSGVAPSDDTVIYRRQ
jgi:hypothetical protein